MTDKCSNCNHKIALNFCPNCGQKKYKRIDKKYLKDEIQYTVLHTNKGFFYTIKNLLKNPGKTGRNFIDGNRVNHYKPILLLFVLSGISVFIANKIIHIDEVMINYYNKHNIQMPFDIKKYQTFFTGYIPLIMLFFIPVQSIFTRIAFAKWKHNYYEHIVMNAFYLSFLQILNILLIYPILYLLKDNPGTFMIVQQVLPFLFMILAAGWFFSGFYYDRNFGDVILRLLLLSGIAFVVIVVISVIGGIVATLFFREEFQEIYMNVPLK